MDEAFGQQLLTHLAARIGDVELVARLRRHNAGQIGALHLADTLRPRNQHVRIRLDRRNHAAHHAAVAQVAHQRTGVNFGEDRNSVALHVLVGYLLGAPVGADLGEFADDQSFDVGPCGLIVGVVRAVVADLWVGEDDDLACVRGIGRNFLVAGERCIKNDLALAFARVSVAVPAEDAPVFERQDRLHRLSEEWIQSILAGLSGSILSGFPLRARVSKPAVVEATRSTTPTKKTGRSSPGDALQCTTPASRAGQ